MPFWEVKLLSECCCEGGEKERDQVTHSLFQSLLLHFKFGATLARVYICHSIFHPAPTWGARDLSFSERVPKRAILTSIFVTVAVFPFKDLLCNLAFQVHQKIYFFVQSYVFLILIFLRGLKVTFFFFSQIHQLHFNVFTCKFVCNWVNLEYLKLYFEEKSNCRGIKWVNWITCMLQNWQKALQAVTIFLLFYFLYAHR
jgi:hypothetical protein